MTVCKPALAIAFLLASGGALAEGANTFTRKGQSLPMTAVYAEATLSELGSGIVLFTDKPEAAQFDEHEQQEQGDYADQLASKISKRGGQVVELKILRSLAPMLWLEDKEGQVSAAFDEKAVHLVVTRYDEQRIEGTVKAKDAKKGLSGDLAFALDLHNGAKQKQTQGAQAHPLVGAAAAQPLATPDKPAGKSAIYIDGKATGLVDSYAFAAADAFDHDERNKGRTIVVLTDGAIDKAALRNAQNPLLDLNRQQDDGKFDTIVVLRLLADGKIFYDIRGDNPSNGLGQPSEVLHLSRNDGKRVEGSYVSKNAQDKKLAGHSFFDFHFALDVAPAK